MLMPSCGGKPPHLFPLGHNVRDWPVWARAEEDGDARFAPPRLWFFKTPCRRTGASRIAERKRRSARGI